MTKRGAANMVGLVNLQPFGQITGNVAEPARHWARTNGAFGTPGRAASAVIRRSFEMTPYIAH